MKKNAKIAVCFLILSALVIWLLRVIDEWHDPKVDGMSLSDWLPHLTYETMSPDTRTNRVWAEEVVRKTGTNAIPLLLEHLSRDEGSSSYQLKEKFTKLAHIEISHPYYQRWEAVAAFKVLGTNGQSAAPQLKVMLGNTNQMFNAALALGAIRAPDALMIFTNLLRDADGSKREAGLHGLGALQEAARPLLPQLVTMTQNEINFRDKVTVIEALGEIGPTEVVLPVLTQITQTDTNGITRYIAAVTMGAFYLEPEKARAALHVAEQDKDQRVREGATIGLKRLEEKIATEELRLIWRRQYYPWPDLDKL